MICIQCGADNKEGSVYCTKCGAPLGEQTAPAKELPPPEPVKTRAKKYKKKLGVPLTALLLAALGWAYGLIYQSDFLTTIYNEATGKTAAIGDNSHYAPLDAMVDDRVLYIVGGAALLLSLIGIWGLFALLRRLWNRIAHRDED